jgi:hypothetical protein
MYRMLPQVDIVQLTRDPSSLRDEVRAAIQCQALIVPHVYCVIGTPRSDDAHRWQTIARARNEGKTLGTSPWVMFVDDDVVLGPDCVSSLLAALQSRPEFAAFGADYLGEMKNGLEHWDYPRHVGMGATLFRRDRLEAVTFRWQAGKCECQCCCDDLRSAGYGIGYRPEAIARHVPNSGRHAHTPSLANVPDDLPRKTPGRVLAAFDGNHLGKFCRQFLATLRASGNAEQVTAVAYGLPSREARLLASMPNVEVIERPKSRTYPAVERIGDFCKIVADWDAETPVAYWDAGDVLFQTRLEPLWELVKTHPDKLLAVIEPFGYPDNGIIPYWCSFIVDPEARRRAFEVLSTCPFLNSGFAAGTARALAHHLGEIHKLIDAGAVRGLEWASDQVVMNLYCHAHPGAWRAIPDGWNYCLAGRNPREFRLQTNGRTTSVSGSPVHVVHGNASTLREVEWYFDFLAVNSGA